jgi:DNA-directed RNA polymerase specialized sigma24 family protein
VSLSSHSVTRWIERLRNDDPQAAQVLWERFLERMLVVARQRLGGASRRVADEEDVVVVAFERFLHGVRQGRFPVLNNRDDLWSVLFTLTVRQAGRQARDQQRQVRGGGAVRGDSALRSPAGDPLEIPAGDPTPAEAVAMQETFAHLLDGLGSDELRRIALARMEGHSTAEIAGQIGRAEVTVQRRLRLIRELWQRLEEEKRENE